MPEPTNPFEVRYPDPTPIKVGKTTALVDTPDLGLTNEYNRETLGNMLVNPFMPLDRPDRTMPVPHQLKIYPKPHHWPEGDPFDVWRGGAPREETIPGTRETFTMEYEPALGRVVNPGTEGMKNPWNDPSPGEDELERMMAGRGPRPGDTRSNRNVDGSLKWRGKYARPPQWMEEGYGLLVPWTDQPDPKVLEYEDILRNAPRLEDLPKGFDAATESIKKLVPKAKQRIQGGGR